MSAQRAPGATSDKRAGTLPPLRVSPALELELRRLADSDRRSLSDYLRVLLERHVWGHSSTVTDQPDGGQE